MQPDRRIKLTEIIKTNSMTYGPNLGWKCINYLDTSSITENEITSIQHINTDDGNLPSRARRLVGYNSILYSMVRPDQKHYGIIKEQPTNFVVSTGFSVIDVDSSKADPDYIYYFLIQQSIVDRLQNIAQQSVSAYPSIRTSDIEELEIALPPISIQRKIANAFNLLSNKIKINKEINTELESLAKTIYDYWFLQFDFSNKDGKPYKSSGGTMVWNENLKMEIPEGWEVVNFMDVADWESNSQPPKSEFIYQEKEGYIRFIQNRDYDSSEHKTYIPWTKGLNTVTRFDILMDKYGDAGATRYGIEGTYNVALGKIVPHDPMMQEYLRLFLSSDHIYHFLHNSCMASTRASLGETSLSLLNVPVPSKELLIEFQSLAHKIREEILILKDENEELISLRDFLLPLFMNGQVGFKDV